MGIVFLALIVAILGAATPIHADDTTEDDWSELAEELAEKLGRLASQAQAIDRIDRFKLWNACEPINLLVEWLDDEDVRMGLTHEAITTTVRSRLRAARLYGTNEITDPSPTLYVNVNSVGGTRAFSVKLDFQKQVSDPISGHNGSATTWSKALTGQHGGDAGYILSGASQLTDMFIDEYLRVNESACPRSPLDP